MTTIVKHMQQVQSNKANFTVGKVTGFELKNDTVTYLISPISGACSTTNH